MESSVKEANANPVPHETDCEDDDPPMLSSHALEALKQFLNEQNGGALDVAGEEEEEVTLVSENWNLSQFWYDRETAETVAGEVNALCSSTDGDSPSVACISCPTLFAYLKVCHEGPIKLASDPILLPIKIYPNLSVQLLEYDNRFKQYGNEFTFYDYNEPQELPASMKHAYQIVVADPPYLSQECLEKVSQTVSFLMQPGEHYLLLLTGDVQRDRAAELLGLRPCGFRPQHSNKLGNEFRLFTNYDPGLRLGGWEQT